MINYRLWLWSAGPCDPDAKRPYGSELHLQSFRVMIIGSEKFPEAEPLPDYAYPYLSRDTWRDGHVQR